MEERLLDKIAEPFNLQLPEYDSIEEMIDNLLPVVGRFSESTMDGEDSPLFHVNWVLMSDKPGATEVVLYDFMERGEIRIFTDGAVSSKSFEIQESGRRIILGASVMRDSFLYDLAFLDEDFFIIRRHGNLANIKNKYIFFTREAIGTRLTWNEALERLADKYRNSQFPIIAVGLVIAAIIAVLLYYR